jgi:hypothetical protein
MAFFNAKNYQERSVTKTHELMHILWQMHPFEHLTDFLSSLIVVLTAASMIYPKTRKNIIRHFRDRRQLEQLDADRLSLNRRLTAMDCRMDTIELSTVTVLHDRLYAACTRTIRRGWTTASEMDNIEHLYDVYHKLGGNGTGTALYMRVKQLPIKAEIWKEK